MVNAFREQRSYIVYESAESNKEVHKCKRVPKLLNRYGNGKQLCLCF